MYGFKWREIDNHSKTTSEKGEYLLIDWNIKKLFRARLYKINIVLIDYFNLVVLSYCITAQGALNVYCWEPWMQYVHSFSEQTKCNKEGPF